MAGRLAASDLNLNFIYMEAITKKKPVSRKKAPHPTKKRMSLPRFIEWVDQQEDGYKYEWKQGVVEKKETMIKKSEWPIVDNIYRVFVTTEAYRKGGNIITTPASQLDEQTLRYPDMAFLTKEQIRDSNPDANPIASFMIELISPTDQVYSVKKKLQEYFGAGVQVVWYIYPAQQQVEVYHSSKEIAICTDDDRCSAAPAVADLSLTPRQIFTL